jgi:hypothetical protein
MYVINESITRDFGASSRVFHAFGHHLNAETFVTLRRAIIDFRKTDSFDVMSLWFVVKSKKKRGKR